MRFLSKNRLAWLMILIMIISPVQAINLAEPGENSHSINCDMTENHSTGQDSQHSHSQCSIDHSEHCNDHAGCVGQLSSLYLNNTSSILADCLTVSATNFGPYTDKVLTPFLDQIKRPPKA